MLPLRASPTANMPGKLVSWNPMLGGVDVAWSSFPADVPAPEYEPFGIQVNATPEPPGIGYHACPPSNSL
jgi:hypothetical protein